MSVLQIKQNIVVKVIVTEQFKNEYKQELSRQLSSVEIKAKEFKSSLARVVIENAGVGNSSYIESLKVRIEEERMLQEAIASELRDRIKEVDGLAIDSVYPYTMLEGLVEVKEGDNLMRKASAAEVVLKDGIVVSIKND
jgi:hypothetical protein